MDENKKWKNAHQGGSSAVYGMGVIGGLVYTVQHMSSFSDFLIGVLHSLFWPAFLLYKAFEFFKF